MSNDLFGTNTPPAIDPNRNYVEELVGENKKFKDFEALARGKAEADAYIATILRQHDELKQELQTRARLEDMLTKLSEKPNPAPSNAPNPLENEPPVAPAPNSVTAENLDQIIANKLVEMETAKTREKNVATAVEALRAAYGDNYVNVLNEKAAELGATPKWFNQLAADNPKALLKLVGAEPKAPAQSAPNLFTPPTSSVSTGFQPTVGERTAAWYKALKVKDPTLYFSNATKVQMHKDAQRLGERFFDT